MINKVYEEVKKIIKENYRFLTLFLMGFLVCYINLPFYIYAPGGLVDISDRFTISETNPNKEQFYMAYVSEYKATIPTYLISLVNKNWEIVEKEKIVASNETDNESSIRSHLMLEEANKDAIINAFTMAHKKIYIVKEDLIISYVDKNSVTDLKINDTVKQINNNSFSNKKELQNYLSSLPVDTTVEIDILRNNKKKKVRAKTRDINGVTKIGIVITSARTIRTNPKIKFNFKDSESGPSGGFMMSLAIYDALTKKDIAKGLKVAGTGTIDAIGNVGEIGGIKYKISGAEKEKADIFFAPSGNNYKEALKCKIDNNYNIEIVEIKTFSDALTYLENRLR